jgi:hypothetical protein
MAAPLVTQAQIIAALQQQWRASLPNTTIEVFSEWPDLATNVRYGVYVADMHQASKEPYQLAVTSNCGIYQVTDQFEILFISFRDDVNADTIMNTISDLPSYTATGSTTPLFDGYHQRTYSQNEEYGPRAVRHSWEFSMERLEFL